MKLQSTSRKSTRRGALLTLELLFVLPLLLGLLLGIVEFGLLLEANQTVKLASEAGAHVASLPGPVAFADIDHAVTTVLAKPALIAGHVTQVTGGTFPGDPVTVEVKVPAIDAVPDLLGFMGFTLVDRLADEQTTLLKQ